MSRVRGKPLLILALLQGAAASSSREHGALTTTPEPLRGPATERPSAPPSRPPNVLLVMADDQGWGDVEGHGNPDLATPHLSALAEEGASFEHFYVSPVCSPTRAELLTGRAHPRSGIYSTSAGGERMDLDERTIADLFGAGGYATGAFGKWHGGTQHPYHPNSRGFGEFYGFCSGHWGHYFDALMDHNGELVRGEGYCSDDFTNRTMAFMERHRDRPFLAYLAFNTPHSPMQVPDRWFEQHAEAEISAPPTDTARLNQAHARAALAMCENIDWNVGRLLRKLEELGLEEDTIVVYLSDNGPNGHRFNGGMRGIKGSTDEGGVRSPLFVRWPGHIPRGQVVQPISAVIDLLPTLAEAAGLEVGDGAALDGVSMLHALTGDGDEPPESTDRMIFSHWGGRVSVRTQRHRLDHKGRLYDMSLDPGQTRDLSKERPQLTAALRAAVEEWRRTVLAECDHERVPFSVGHRAHPLTRLPARDGLADGGILRSNRFPNCSFFTRWKSTKGVVRWPVEVVEGGRFRAQLLYACAAEDVGATMELRFGDRRLEARVEHAHDVPLYGMERDRSPRQESYVKDFGTLELGSIELLAGTGALELRALRIPGDQALELRMLLLRRTD